MGGRAPVWETGRPSPSKGSLWSFLFDETALINEWGDAFNATVIGMFDCIAREAYFHRNPQGLLPCYNQLYERRAYKLSLIIAKDAGGDEFPAD